MLHTPLSNIKGTAASVSTLLIQVGLPQSPFTEDRAGVVPDCPRRPSMEAIRAVSSPQTKRACAKAHDDIEVPSGAQDVFPRGGPVCAPDRWPCAHASPARGYSAADVEESALRPHGVATDHEPFEDRVGIPFEDAAVHERAGVAFIGHCK